MARATGIALALIVIGQAACAQNAGRSEYVFASSLAARGFEPFAASAAGNASFGMKKGGDMYLCFLADDLQSAADRQQVLVEELNGQNPDREVPNIPVVCVLTQ